MKDNKYMVFALCSTYNQSNYIKDTLDGFCMQQTNFPFVCGIIDDASTDGEQEVLMKYLKDNFYFDSNERFRKKETDDYVRIIAQHRINHNCHFLVVLLKTNHYQLRKDRMVYVSKWQDNSKYTAPCEGDDYWIDPLKLQKQVDYLEQHKECGLVYAKAKTFIQKTKQFRNVIGSCSKDFDELLLHNSIVTATAIYRLSLIKDYSVFIGNKKWKMGDKPLWLYIAHNSTIHFLDEVVSVYRILEDSATSRNSFEKRKEFINDSVAVQLYYAKLYKPEYINIIENDYNKYLFHAAIEFRKFDTAIDFYHKISNPNAKLKFEYAICKILGLFYHE